MIPLASNFMYNLLEKLNLPKEYDILNIKLGALQTKAELSINGDKIVEMMIKKYPKLNFTNDSHKAVFNDYGVMMTIYKTSNKTCEIELQLPFNDKKDIKECVKTIVYELIKSEGYLVNHEDIMILNSNLDEFSIGLDIDDVNKFVYHMCSRHTILKSQLLRDGEKEYGLLTLDLGFITIKVNNSNIKSSVIKMVA